MCLNREVERGEVDESNGAAGKVIQLVVETVVVHRVVGKPGEITNDLCKSFCFKVFVVREAVKDGPVKHLVDEITAQQDPVPG